MQRVSLPTRVIARNSTFTVYSDEKRDVSFNVRGNVLTIESTCGKTAFVKVDGKTEIFMFSTDMVPRDISKCAGIIDSKITRFNREYVCIVSARESEFISSVNIIYDRMCPDPVIDMAKDDMSFDMVFDY